MTEPTYEFKKLNMLYKRACSKALMGTVLMVILYNTGCYIVHTSVKINESCHCSGIMEQRHTHRGWVSTRSGFRAPK